MRGPGRIRGRAPDDSAAGDQTAHRAREWRVARDDAGATAELAPGGEPLMHTVAHLHHAPVAFAKIIVGRHRRTPRSQTQAP